MLGLIISMEDGEKRAWSRSGPWCKPAKRCGSTRRCVLREGINLTAEAQSFNKQYRANFPLPDAFTDQPMIFGKMLSAKDPRRRHRVFPRRPSARV